MIPKKTTGLSDPSNYRPISITSSVSKVAEYLVLARINKFLKKNNTLKPHQSGFRRKRQKKDNLLLLIQKVTESFADGKKALAIFFDIQGAFDRVYHDCLLYKLIRTGLDHQLVCWINNYLRSRTMRVKVEDSYSREIPLHTSVPQGGILSPILFAIYINDLPLRKLFSNKATVLFADDLAYVLTFRNPSIGQRIVNRYLNELTSWMNQWRLTLAKHKFKCIFFQRRATKNNFTFPVMLENARIEQVHSTKFLGLVIDSKLRFNNQVNELVRSCTSRLRLIRILSRRERKLGKSCLIQIYTALIRSLLDYSSQIVFQVSKSDLLRLERIQRAALKSILRLRPDTPTVDLNKLHDLGTIEHRFINFNANHIQKAKANGNPIINSCLATLQHKQIRTRATSYYNTLLGELRGIYSRH